MQRAPCRPSLCIKCWDFFGGNARGSGPGGEAFIDANACESLALSRQGLVKRIAQEKGGN